jgi:hypothetical protein
MKLGFPLIIQETLSMGERGEARFTDKSYNALFKKVKRWTRPPKRVLEIVWRRDDDERPLLARVRKWKENDIVALSLSR